MSIKSTPDQYGSVSVMLHWLTALLIVIALVTGFVADDAAAADAAGILTVHVPVATTVLLLTLARIAWWWFADTKPTATGETPAWQDRSAKAVHGLFYVVIVLMAASGIAMLALSGAVPILFGGAAGALPNFEELAPRGPHELGAWLMVALFVVHVAAAFYHQFMMRDALLGRMWFGGKVG
ncbi:MAG: cytochrome b [Alphaproteobacteria bacterium]